jgi:hyperosmotically inducible periplasmic protein
MRFLSTALFCLGAVAACSHQPETNATYDASTANGQHGALAAETAEAPMPSPAPAMANDGAQTGAAAQYRPAAAEAPATPSPAAGPSQANPGNPVARAPDNTATNKRDSDGKTLTPMDQKENATDLKITQQIRQAVMANDSLSFTAKNAKIITINGNVTLRGPVNSTDERAAIEAAARRVPGILSVDNQLEVKK